MASREELERALSLREIVKERLDTLSRVEIEKWINELVLKIDSIDLEDH